VFVLSEKLSQFVRRFVPLLATSVIGFEDARHGSPAYITGEDGLFIICSVPALGFQVFEDTDCRDIFKGLLVQASLTYAVCICDSEVA
jgi:hypothetical protein